MTTLLEWLQDKDDSWIDRVIDYCQSWEKENAILSNGNGLCPFPVDYTDEEIHFKAYNVLQNLRMYVKRGYAGTAVQVTRILANLSDDKDPGDLDINDTVLGGDMHIAYSLMTALDGMADKQGLSIPEELRELDYEGCMSKLKYIYGIRVKSRKGKE